MNGYLVIVSAIIIAVPTIQHYIPPPNMCIFAMTCNHTWVPECGFDGKSGTKRLFLDKCDMYEYNCDYKKEYIQIGTTDCPQDCTKSGALNNFVTQQTITTPSASTITTPILSSLTSSMNDEPQASPSILTSEAPTSTPSMLPESSTTLSTTSKTTSTSTPTITSTIEFTTESIPTTSVSSTALHTSTPKITSAFELTTESIPTTSVLSKTFYTSIPAITSTIELTTESIPTTSVLSTAFNTTYSTSTSPIAISTQSASNSSYNTTKYLISEIREEIIDYNCSRKTTLEMSSAIEKTNPPETTLTKSNITSQIIESTATTHILPSHLKTEEKISVPNTALNMTCSNYPEDCDRPVTWETTVEGETRDFYQILKQRFGRRVRLLKDTTHWPRRSAVKISGKKDSFLFGRHNDIIATM